jgi:hypothetical protein
MNTIKNKSNLLLDLPDDVLILIYKYVFKDSLEKIENNNMRSLYDFYDLLKKSKLCYCINMRGTLYTHNSNDNDDNDDNNNIYLYRKYYTEYDNKLSKIKYIEYPISYVSSDFIYIKNVIEEFASIIYNDDNEDRQLMKLHRNHSGIYRLEYTENSFRIFIDKNKLSCRVDLEKAIILGYDLIYYSLKLINILELNTYDYSYDIDGIFEWIENYNLLEGYLVSDYIVAVQLSC